MFLQQNPTQLPRVINVDKNVAYPPCIEQLKAELALAQAYELRQNKYLNNMVEQDHRFIKKSVNSGLGFQSFYTARRRTIIDYETMHRIRKGQIQGVEKGNILGQVEFVSQLFGIDA